MTIYLNVAEIFRSIDGEVNHFCQGRQTVFLRLAGCNLAYNGNTPCSYCDTKQYQLKDSGKKMTIKQVKDKINQLGGRSLTVTGGEPLMQFYGLSLLLESLDHDKISIETNGTIKMPIFSDYWISFVFDCKLTDPQFALMKRINFISARKHDFFKMVITSDECLYRAIQTYHDIRRCNKHVNIAFSPMFGDAKWYAWQVRKIVETLEKEGIYDVIVNTQLHKLVDMK
jgi:organic radical activating enzyme